MTSVALNESAYITLNGSGAGTAKLGPLSAREVWHPQNVAVSANPNPVNEALCQIYVGDANTQRLMDTSVSGSTGDATDKTGGATVKSGQYVWAVWTGGDPGVRAVLTVTGTKDV